MDFLTRIVTDIELHSVSGIEQCFRNGLDPNTSLRNEPLIIEQISEYTRSTRFTDCVKVCMTKTYTLRTAYTPIYEASLLHICAEFNLVACAGLLIGNGVNINAPAGKDAFGFVGQSPVFHTVNQNSNQSAAMLELLLQHGADLSITVPGFIWGKSYDWETFIPAVNPISYCMMGLFPHMHRDELVISKTISRLLKHTHGIDYALPNIPNAYLFKMEAGNASTH